MTFRLVHASHSLPEGQAVKLTFFAPFGHDNDTDMPFGYPIDVLISHIILLKIR